MRILAEEIDALLGISANEMTIKTCNEIEWEYRILEGEERERTLLDRLKFIKNDKKIVATPERESVWEDGWEENYLELIQKKNIRAIYPKYYNNYAVCRYKHNYILGEGGVCVSAEMQRLMLKCLCQIYMRDVDFIYEFGCGTGYNLVELANLYPQKRFIGLDFTKSSQKILDTLNNAYGYNIVGLNYNFFSYKNNVSIAENSAIFTVAALEQTYDKWTPFLDFLLKQKPSVCVHVEPIEELYDEDDLFDWVALEFHKKRHYLKGFYTELKKREKNGELKIIDVRRLHYGSCNDEESLIVWKPC